MRNKISYLGFVEHFKSWGVFTTQDIIKYFPGFDSRRLFEWKQKGYIIKLAKTVYCFPDFCRTEMHLFRVANKLYPPSYVSFETALAFHNLIPEAVMQLKSATTKKTYSCETEIGNFEYKNIKETLFFGYAIHHVDEQPVLIAEPEKALLDLIYQNPSIKTKADFDGLRLNESGMANFDWVKMETYLTVFNQKSMNERFKIISNQFQHA